MKKNLLLITTFIASFWVSGQNIFERYADNDKVTLVSISPKMFKMLGQMSLSLDDPEAQEYMEMREDFLRSWARASEDHKIRPYIHFICD